MWQRLAAVSKETQLLYRLEQGNGKYDPHPVEFKDISHFGQHEKDLEDLISDLVSRDAQLMPIYQEHRGEEVADIYALDRTGDLTLFELKRSSAGTGAAHQVLGYAPHAGQWTYSDLTRRFRKYQEDKREPIRDLPEAHQEAFDLAAPLPTHEFNRQQHLVVIGSGADENLIRAVDYWRRHGISIDFVPYRIYELEGERYLELFSRPYDSHRNPADVKGVLFDTCRAHDEDAIWHMMEKERVAAWGDAMGFVGHVSKGDTVFYSHSRTGVVATAQVTGDQRADVVENEMYRDVEFLTPVPRRGSELKAMPFARVREITGKSFFWARTIKVPYLSVDETKRLLEELQVLLASDT